MPKRTLAQMRAAAANAREARSLKIAERKASQRRANGLTAHGENGSTSQFTVLYGERGQVVVSPVTPLRFTQADAALAFANLLSDQFPEKQFVVSLS